jgi:STE24 endopeptidase
MTPVAFAIAGLLVATEAFFTLLSVLNVRHGAATLSAEADWVAAELDVEDPDAVVAYQRAKTRLGIVRRWTVLVAVLVALLAGPVEWAVGIVQSTGLGPVAGGLAFLLGASVVGNVLSWPFDLYDTFRIEERFGFNNQTPALWVRDRLVGLVVTLAIGGVVGGVILLAVVSLPTLWPLAGWGVYVGFSLLFMIVYPRVIAPLFNDFVPVDDALREAVDAVFERAGFRTDEVYEMDASRRSSHANAYFVGFGEAKRVVLFDTLVEQHPVEEVQAVLAHELAHWKRAHIWKQLGAGAVQMGAVFALLGWLVDQGWLYAAFGLPETPYVGLLLAALVVWPLGRLSAPLSNRLSLAHEREADDFAAEIEGPDALAEALLRLTGENLSNPFPHPWYAAFHYTHPPVPERVRRLRSKGTATSGAGAGGSEGAGGTDGRSGADDPEGVAAG